MTWPEFSDRVLRGNAVSLAAYALIVIQLVWKACVLRHFYFWEDDFVWLDRAAHSGLTWGYLMRVQAGHLVPGPMAVAWVTARLSIYNWTLAGAELLALVLVSSLALLRLLRTLFGNRPAILIPLVIYLVCPLTVPGLVWWSVGVEGVPLQFAIFMYLDAHVRYVRTRQLRSMIMAAVWLLVGMVFNEKAALLPFFVFAVTAAFLTEGSWVTAALRSAARYWRAWAAYGGLVAVYAVIFVIEVSAPGALPTKTGPPRGVGAFMADLSLKTFVPGAFGGPWQWFPNGTNAFATPSAALLRLSVLMAVVVIAATIWYRRYAWRAWAILAMWLVVVDMVPVIVGRAGLQDPMFTVFLGLDTHYVADAVPILAICLGLAIWQVNGQPDHARRRPHPALPAGVAPTITGFVLAAFAFGSIYSVQTYMGATSSQPARSFIATVRQALAAVPPGTPVVDQLAPPSVMASLLFGANGYEDQVIGSMDLGRIRWIRQPDGVIANLKIFTADGRLWPATVVGVYSKLIPDKVGCWPTRQGTVTVQLNGTAKIPYGSWTMEMSYVATTAQSVSVHFGSRSAPLFLRAGENTAYLPIRGSGSSVMVVPSDPSGLCVGDMAVGGLFNDEADTPVPLVPASG